MTGPATLADHVVPTITRAAAEAGRPAPRIGAGLPVCVTDDVDAARERAAAVFQVYGRSRPTGRCSTGKARPARPTWPSWRRGVGAGAVRAHRRAGVTDLVGVEFASHKSPDRARTREFLKSLV